MLTSIISAIIILGTLVLIHEAGHFVVAKRCGVRVLRFSIGYPPKLFGIRRGETEYAIGLYLSQLKTRIIKAPPFWTSAPNYPGNINDFNLISFLFEKALSAEILYKDQLKKKREEALQTAQNAVKLIKARANPDPKE